MEHSMDIFLLCRTGRIHLVKALPDPIDNGDYYRDQYRHQRLLLPRQNVYRLLAFHGYGLSYAHESFPVEHYPSSSLSWTWIDAGIYLSQAE